MYFANSASCENSTSFNFLYQWMRVLSIFKIRNIQKYYAYVRNSYTHNSGFSPIFIDEVTPGSIVPMEFGFGLRAYELRGDGKKRTFPEVNLSFDRKLIEAFL